MPQKIFEAHPAALEGATAEELQPLAARIKAVHGRIHQTRPELNEALVGSPSAPNLALLSADARRFGEAGEIFGARLLGPKANELTYGIAAPKELPAIALPSQVLEACKNKGAYLMFQPDKAPDGSPLPMLAMHRLTQQRWNAQGRGKLLFDKGGWKENERFFTKGAPRPGWRVIFPDVVDETPDKDDIRQTELLIAETCQLFRGTPLPRALEETIAKFEADKARIRALMEHSQKWLQASEAIEAQPINKLIRPTSVGQVGNLMAVGLECRNERAFGNIYTRLPVRSSLGGLVSVGFFDAHGALVYDYRPGDALPSIGASLSLPS